ncbi:MAG: hypothetical protein LBC18_00940 [Opitutaceae bacterium]|jgi:sialate O-acetylesterase|nr:hypothetical protein [Opitutaceae bacterium]
MKHHALLRHSAFSALAFAALALAALASPAAAPAGITPAALFQDHAVLQCDLPVPVWGRAAAGEEVRVTLAPAPGVIPSAAGEGGAVASETTAGADGRWLVRLPPLAASVAPRELVITAAARPLIRSFRVGVQLPEAPAEDALGQWAVCSPETVGDLSAAAPFLIKAAD